MITTPPTTRPRRAGRVIDRLATRMLGLPRATTGYTIETARVPTRDGLELAADLYRAKGDAVGSLLVRSPYGRYLPMALPMARIFADRGYNVLLVSSRGTFGSGGTFDPMQTEIDDGHDVVACASSSRAGPIRSSCGTSAPTRAREREPRSDELATRSITGLGGASRLELPVPA